MAIKRMANAKKWYAVVIYPPTGCPRVVEIPDMPMGQFAGCKMFRSELKAHAALEKFLTENPEYRTWKDGKLNG